MDPLSIATAALSIPRVCITVSKYVSSYIDSCHNVDNDVTTLRVDVEELSKFLIIFRETVISEGFNSKGVSQEVWEMVEISLEDCKLMLKKLEDIMREINDVEFG